MKRRNKRNLLVGLSFLLTFALSGGIFAYWAIGVTGNTTSDTNTITIGTGNVATTTLDLGTAQATQGELVPVGYEDEDSVSEIVVSYNVFLEEGIVGNGSEGAIASFEITNAPILEDVYNLINVSVNTQSNFIEAGGDSVLVVVTITLTEPANVTEYNSIAGLDFDITLTFTATFA